MRRLVTVLIVVCSMSLVGVRSVVAQDATPIAGSAATCDAAPPSADELLALWYGDATAPDATPVSASEGSQADTSASVAFTIPVGEPADAATIAGVTETVHSVFACFDEGNVLGAFAYFTDDLRVLFGPEPGTPRSNTEAFLAGNTGEEEEGEDSQLVAVASVMMLEDGRAGAFVVERYPAGDAASFGYFEQAGDRWLVDEIIEFALPGEGEGGA